MIFYNRHRSDDYQMIVEMKRVMLVISRSKYQNEEVKSTCPKIITDVRPTLTGT